MQEQQQDSQSHGSGALQEQIGTEQRARDQKSPKSARLEEDLEGDLKADFRSQAFTFSGMKEVEADDLAAEMKRQAMDMQEAKFEKQAEELENLYNRFDDLFHKVDKFETRINMVKMFEQKLQEFAEHKVEVEAKVNGKLQEFELLARTQSSQVKDVVEESKQTASATFKFRAVMDRLEQEVDSLRASLSEKINGNHQQITKKINMANYEIDNYRGDILKLKAQVEALVETTKSYTQQFTDLDLKVDQCDKMMIRLQNETLSRKQYKMTHSVLDSEVKGHFDMICQIKRQVHRTDLYLDRYLPVATLNMIKGVHEDTFSRKSDRRSFLLQVMDKYKELEEQILEAEEEDQIHRDVLQHRCKLDKRYYEVPEISVGESEESEDEDSLDADGDDDERQNEHGSQEESQPDADGDEDQQDEENDEGDKKGSEMEGGSTDSQRSGGRQRRPRSQKPKKVDVPRILDFDEVYKSEQAKRKERESIANNEAKSGSFVDKENAVQSEIEIRSTSQQNEETPAVGKPPILTEGQEALSRQKQETGEDKTMDQVDGKASGRSRDRQQPSTQAPRKSTSSRRDQSEKKEHKQAPTGEPSAEKIKTGSTGKRKKKDENAQQSSGHKSKKKSGEKGKKTPQQAEKRKPQKPIAAVEDVDEAMDLFTRSNQHVQPVMRPFDDDESDLERKKRQEEEKAEQKEEAKPFKFDLTVTQVEKEEERVELTAAELRRRAREKLKAGGQLIPKFALSDEAGEFGAVQSMLRKPKEEGQGMDSEEASQAEKEEELDKMAELLSTDPQQSQDAATLAGLKSETGKQTSSQAANSAKPDHLSQSQSYAITSSDNKFEGGKDSQQASSQPTQDQGKPQLAGSDSNQKGKSSKTQAKKTVTIIEEKEEIADAESQEQQPESAAGSKPQQMKIPGAEKSEQASARGATVGQKAKAQVQKGSSRALLAADGGKKAAGPKNRQPSKKDLFDSPKKKQQQSEGLSLEQLDKVLKEHPIIMEVKAKLDVFGKKYEKQFTEMKKVQRDSFEKLMADIKNLQEELENERVETLKDISQVDENLNEQLKFTSEYLKDTVREWNSQNQAYFDKQVGNLHAKVLQVKSDNILNNERIMSAIGVNHPNLSSKTTIFALNKVIEMILQYLVTNSLLNYGNSNEMPIEKQLSGSFRPVQQSKNGKKHWRQHGQEKSTQIELQSLNEKSSQDIVPQLDIEPAMQMTENTVSKRSTPHAVNHEMPEPRNDVKHAVPGATVGPPVYFQHQRLQKQSTEILESAWLLHQEMNIAADQVETNTVKQLKILYRNNRVDEMQKKMKAIRSKWLQSDQDATLSIKAMLLYDEIVKNEVRLPEQNIVTSLVNQNLWNMLKCPQDQIFQIQTDYIKGEQQLVDPHVSIITNENVAGSSCESQNTHVNPLLAISDLQSLDRLMSPLSLAGGFGGLQFMPRPQTQFQDTERSGMNVSALSDLPQQPLLVQRKDRNPIVPAQKRQRQLQKLTAMALNMKNLREEPKTSDRISNQPSIQQNVEAKNVPATDRINLILEQSPNRGHWNQKQFNQRNILTPQSQVHSKQDWRRASAPNNKLFRSTFNPSPTDRANVPLFMPKMSLAGQPTERDRLKPAEKIRLLQETGRTFTSDVPTVRLNSHETSILGTAILASVRDSNVKGYGQRGQPTDSITDSTLVARERAQRMKNRLIQQHNVMRQSDFEPRNIQNMRDAAIQKKVFSFPVVEGKKEKKN